VSSEDAREDVGRRRILDIPARPGEPGLAAGDGGGSSVVSSGVGIGAAHVKFEVSTGGRPHGHWLCDSRGGCREDVRVGLTPRLLHPLLPHPRLPQI
jgi:hypothetical protein